MKAKSPSKTESATSPKRSTPAKLTIGGLITAIALALYSAARPALNQHFGWNLPELKGQTQTQVEEPQEYDGYHEPVSTTGIEWDDYQEVDDDKVFAEPEQDKSRALPDKKRVEATEAKTNDTNPERVQPRANKQEAKQPSPPKETSPSKGATSKSTSSAVEKENLLHGILRDTGREEYVSPAGLRYTRGSAEGHRLKHLERHVVDDKNRPGRHGVFLGGLPGALQVIDEAYVKAKQGGKDVSKTTDEEYGQRVIYVVNLRRKIGYIGGMEGNRMNRPSAFKVQIVLDGDRVITSYPR